MQEQEQDPFSFFINHASAIGGLGGDDMSPDPRYCFHTRYVEVHPGPARYELHLNGVRASRGELALRVHAFRPQTGENASLVAGARLDVVVDDQQDLAVSVRFSALRNVQYAFYGFFIEDSDIHAQGLKIVLHETEGDGDVYIEPPRSILALDEVDRDVRPANALIHVVTPHITAPVSQDSSLAQMAELAATRGTDVTLDDWAEALCLNALHAYDVTIPALEGLVVGDCSADFIADLTHSGFVLSQMAADPAPPANSGLFADFVVWPDGPCWQGDAAARWDSAKAWLGRLKIGGVGAVVLRYSRDNGPARGGIAVDGERMTNNEISKWALRLIADGYSVAPLAFSPAEDVQLDEDGLARFILIVRRQ